MPSANDVATAYHHYGPALLRKATRMLRSEGDAEDVVHSLFTDFVAKPPKSLELPFLYRSVTNRCLNTLRDANTRARLLAANPPTDELQRSTCEGVAISLELLAQLTDRLDRRSLEVLVCLFIDDMSQDEAAAALDTSRKTVGKRLAKIRAQVETMKAEVAA